MTKVHTPRPKSDDKTAPPELADFMIRGVKVPASTCEQGLYIVATPIGNLSDITLRALDVLATCDLLLCEDTRVTRRLLDRYGISVPISTYHDHSDEDDRRRILSRLDEGHVIALVSDAGTPLVSDPGYKLVSAALSGGHRVIPIPGASSVTAALSASGLPTHAFHFVGFLPPKTEARRKTLMALSDLEATLIILESPRRLDRILADAIEILDDRPVVIAREMTKIHEEFYRGTLRGFTDSPAGISTKGEVVVLIGPPTNGSQPLSDEELDQRLSQALQSHSVNRAARLLADETGLAKRDLYRRAQALKDQSS